MIYGRHLLEGTRQFILPDVLILTLTPGIPFEWVLHVGNFGTVRKSELRRLIATATTEDHAKAIDNAASITLEDAFAMLNVTRPEFHGAVPMYAQMWLQASRETDAMIARILGLKPSRIMHWRTKINFDPLTGARL